MSFKSINKDLLFTKNDSADPRLGEFVKIENKEPEKSFVVLGYPDHEGVHNNGGRVGAANAPDCIRKCLYRMTPHLFKKAFPFFDLGNVELTTLEKNHAEVQKKVSSLISKNNRIISFGGGHDYGYPDGAGFLDAMKGSEAKPLVINLDAHLDVRPFTDKINSGTPFFRLLKDFPQKFDFVELGIQSQCNSQEHLDWVVKQGAQVLTFDELLFSGESHLNKILNFLEPHILRKRPTFLSIDIDAFSSQYAPGCSQSFATGFNPETVLALVEILAKRLDIKLFSIYEVSPPLDQDDKTSKLAALLAHKFLFSAS